MPTAQENSDFIRFKSGTLDWGSKPQHFELFEAIGFDEVSAALEAEAIRNPEQRAVAIQWTRIVEEAKLTKERAEERRIAAEGLEAAKASAKASKDAARMAALAAFISLVAIVVQMFWER